jgi:hypothetical protein
MSDSPTPERAPSPFESFARLYAAATPGVVTTVVEASDSWTSDGVRELLAEPAIWGSLSTHGGGPLGAALRQALRRERALVEIRRRHGDAITAVHRLAPSVRGNRLRPAIRLALRGGLLVELRRSGHERVIDLVLREAGAAPDTPVRLRPRGDGSALGMFRTAKGQLAMLRVTMADSAHIRENADALAALEAAGTALAPRLLGRGAVAGAEWSAETMLPGNVRPRLQASLVNDTVTFCASLPGTSRASSLRERMLALAERHERWGPLLRQLADTAVPEPGMLQHGDLWLRNLLAAQGRLSGVVDWETWHPAGVPGTDLLHLVSMNRRGRAREDIGALWNAGVWRSDSFVALARPYWGTLGIELAPTLLEAVGLDWWAGQVLRQRRQSTSPEWVRKNVDGVLKSIGGSP